jgi:predicted nucleic acid-binding protein
MHEKIVIADTSCLISLTKIEALGVLQQLYGEVYITEEIAGEFGEYLPDWVKIEHLLLRSEED